MGGRSRAMTFAAARTAAGVAGTHAGWRLTAAVAGLMVISAPAAEEFAVFGFTFRVIKLGRAAVVAAAATASVAEAATAGLCSRKRGRAVGP